MEEQQVETEIKTKGLSAPRITPADLDATIARSHARDKIWALEGYRLKQKLHEAAAA